MRRFGRINAAPLAGAVGISRVRKKWQAKAAKSIRCTSSRLSLWRSWIFFGYDISFTNSSLFMLVVLGAILDLHGWWHEARTGSRSLADGR